MRNIEEERGTVNFGSVPFEAYVHAICSSVSDFYKKARELLMLYTAFEKANTMYQIILPASIRNVKEKFEASAITAGEVVDIMNQLLEILKQKDNAEMIEAMYVEVPKSYFATADRLLEDNTKQVKHVQSRKFTSKLTKASDGKSVILEFEDGSAIVGVTDDIHNIMAHDIKGDLDTIYRQHGIIE